MLPRWFQAVLMVFFEAWSARRDTQIRFLKLQTEMLRQKLPGNRVIVSPEDRSRLLKLGAEMNHQVDDLMGIASVKTYRRWLRDQKAGSHLRSQSPAKSGQFTGSSFSGD